MKCSSTSSSSQGSAGLLHSWFERSARTGPGAVALVVGDERVTYGELNTRANRLARHLQALGVRPGDRLGLCARRDLNLYIGLLGILKSGCSYVPLDPDWPAERANFILQDSGCRVLVTAGVDASGLAGDKIDLLADAGLIASRRRDALVLSITPDREAYVIYTSGTTGVPKGVPIRHRQVSHRIATMCEIYALGPEDRVLQFAPLIFDASIEQIFTALSSGATLIARPDSWSVNSLLTLLERERVTIIDVTPSVWNALTFALVNGEMDLPPALTRVCLGGERVDAAKVALWFEHFKIPLLNGYGPTEATITATVHRIDRAEEPVLIGKPVSGVRAYVMDKFGAPVRAGESGELWLGGVGIADGYLNRPDQTADRFVVGPDGDRVYRTGDRVRWTEEGALEFLGRLDDQVKIGGVRIEPDEVAVTLAGHPDISAAHVGIRDVHGDDCLVAYVVPHDYRQIPTARQLREFLSGKLPAAFVPGYFTILERMPLLASGKLDRVALSEIDIAPRRLISKNQVPPRPGREARLAAIWAEELGLEQVGAQDDLMSLGAHSLRSIRVAVQIARLEGVDLSSGELLRAPTVRAQAELVDRRQGGPRRFPPITPARMSRVPMSMQQKQVWFLANLDPADLSYRFQAVIRVSGVLDLDVVDRVITEIHRRHPILRTTFSGDDEGYWQHIHLPAAAAAQRIDLRGLPEAERREAADGHVEQAIAAPLDLTGLPLQKWTVVQLGDEQFELVMLESHIVHDGWSFALIMSEFLALYSAYLSGRPSPLPEPVLTYGDYAAWQQRELGPAGALSSQVGKWRERLTGLPDPVSIVPDGARPAFVGHEGGIVRVSLPGSLPDRMRAFCRERRVTLFEMMSAAFYVFLAQHTRQADFCIGSAFANRRLIDTQDVVGMFVNTVLLRASVRAEETFEELIREVQRDLNEADDLQEVPFPELVRALNPKRSTAANPFAQVMFSAHDSAFPELNFGAAAGTISYPSNRSAKFDLNVIVHPRDEAYAGRREVSDQRITMSWEYNSALFAETTVERMAGRYIELIQRLLAEPALPFSRLPLIGDAEMRELAVLGRGPAPQAGLARADSWPEPARVVDYIGAWARAAPDLAAVQDDNGRVTYGELEDLSGDVARTLLARGLESQSVVGVFVERGRDLPIAAAAAHKARMAYAPIDPAEPAERLATMLDAVDIVLCSESTIGRIPAGEAAALTVTDACRVGRGLPTPPLPDGAEEDLAYIIHTSGSTGRPKGVMIEQGGLAGHIRWSIAELPLPQGALIPCTASQSFDVSVWEMWRVLAAGATCLLTSVRMTPDEVVRLLAAHYVTHCYLPTPLAMHLLTHHHDSLPDLVWLGAGGDRLELPAGTLLPFALTNLYGPAEATIWATAFSIPAGTVIGNDLAVPPIGRPITGAEVVVVDQAGRPVPIGVPGELWIGGRCVGRGYHRSPEHTAERFVTRRSPDGRDVRYYRTGDLVRWNSQGDLEFLGRLDRQVKVRGYRIELSEIEVALRAKTAIKDCAVIAERRERSDAADMDLVAFIVQSAEGALDARSLRAALKDRLPDYMIPAVFVAVDRIPLTGNGKVDVAALANGSRRRIAVQDARPVGPRDELERAIAGIWADALRIETVGINDNFFDLGGHSLMVTQLINRVEHSTGVRLSIREVYDSPTVAEMKTALLERVVAEQPGAASASGRRL